jgi:hypothetical protein
MRISSSSRRVSIVTIFAVLFLAFMVLGWGTGYKLSLYRKQGSPSSSIPAAKLLSQKERVSTARAAELVLDQAPNHDPSMYYTAIIIASPIFGLGLTVSACMREVAMCDARRQRSAYSNFFFFRPPPALLLSN